MAPQADLFPPELTALRAAGLIAAIAIIAYAVARRRQLRNVDVLILLGAGFGLAIVSGTELTDALLSAFSFQRGNGGRILGLAVFAIFILFLLILRALSVAARNSRELVVPDGSYKTLLGDQGLSFSPDHTMKFDNNIALKVAGGRFVVDNTLRSGTEG